MELPFSLAMSIIFDALAIVNPLLALASSQDPLLSKQDRFLFTGQWIFWTLVALVYFHMFTTEAAAAWTALAR